MIRPLLLWLLEQIGLAALRRWWGGGKPPEQLEDEHALAAKTREAGSLAAPARGKSAVVDSMQSRVKH